MNSNSSISYHNTMNLLEASTQLKSEPLDDFCLDIYFGANKKVEVKGFFSKTGSSIYANLPDFNLTAGSGATISEEVKTKAVARVLHLLKIQLLYEEDTKSASLANFRDYLRKKENDQPEYLLNEEKEIPIFNETVEPRPDGSYRVTMKRGRSIQNLRDIQNLAQKDIQSNPTSSSTETNASSNKNVREFEATIV